MLCPLPDRSSEREKSGLSNFLSRGACRRMPHRTREDAHRFGGGDHAPLRSLSRAPPCGRKESGNDRRRIGRGGGRDCRGGCGSAAIVESENQAEEQGTNRFGV